MNTPKGVMLKSLDWVLYAVFVAVTVMIHSVIPLKESVSDGIIPGTIAGFIDSGIAACRWN